MTASMPLNEIQWPKFLKKFDGQFSTENLDRAGKGSVGCSAQINRETSVVFGKGLDWKKWIGTVANLIDMRKKVRMFCIEKWNFLFCCDFFIWKVIKSDWCDIKSKNIMIDFEKIFFGDFTNSIPSIGKQGPRAHHGRLNKTRLSFTNIAFTFTLFVRWVMYVCYNARNLKKSNKISNQFNWCGKVWQHPLTTHNFA